MSEFYMVFARKFPNFSRHLPRPQNIISRNVGEAGAFWPYFQLLCPPELQWVLGFEKFEVLGVDYRRYGLVCLSATSCVCVAGFHGLVTDYSLGSVPRTSRRTSLLFPDPLCPPYFQTLSTLLQYTRSLCTTLLTRLTVISFTKPFIFNLLTIDAFLLFC